MFERLKRWLSGGDIDLDEKTQLITNLLRLTSRLKPEVFKDATSNAKYFKYVDVNIKNLYSHIINLALYRRAVELHSVATLRDVTASASQRILFTDLFLDDEGYELDEVETLEELREKVRDLASLFNSMERNGDHVRNHIYYGTESILKDTLNLLEIIVSLQD